MARGRTGTTARRNLTVHRCAAIAAVFVIAFLAVGAAQADAETRFAAPGGTGSAPCPRTEPCSLYVAASYEAPQAERIHSGDEVVVLPGEYSGARGDLGPDEIVQIPTGTYIHGEAGAPRPVIVSYRHGWVLTLASGDSTGADLEIVAPNADAPLLISQSVAERMVVTAGAEGGIACEIAFRGVLRDSVCISTGKGGAGAGQRTGTNSFPMHTRTLRNVTAIGTGPESSGIRFDISGGEIFVNVKSSIARGTGTDIEAIGEDPGGGPTVTVEESDYATASATEKNGGTASVTAPGTNGNITAAPLLDETTFHELPGSPTIDQGAVDSFSGAADVDGDARVIGGQADIGADEMTLPTTTGLTCLPSSLDFGEEASCAAVVEAEDWGPPTGAVELTATGGLKLGECELEASGVDQARCEVHAPVLAVDPSLQLTATYPGDESRAPSQGTFVLSVEPARTTIRIACAPGPAVVDDLTSCTASVANLAASLAPPTGEVHFQSSGPGIFPGAPSCTLIPTSPSKASCQVAYKPTAIGAGPHQLDAAYAGDDGHDGSTAQLSLPVKAKQEPAPTPKTFLKHKPPRRTSHRVAVFAFASSQPHARFQCKLDSKRYRHCHSPKRLEVSPGRHVFRVRAIGEAGVDATPATFRWTVTEPHHP